ncbi:hypothetical protein [Streptacidiphilus anmyonensis]|uniref:hypothetical protein n=1 Tax=Streptacidiphilus anmyonensis TaxID=405782 RepID=UPI00128CCEB8|nr:hypothetical protein [Streptacidiphilus anmyonensis]
MPPVMSRNPAAPEDDEPDDGPPPLGVRPPRDRTRRAVHWLLCGHSAPELLRLPPAQVNRMLTVLACASMLIGARDIWNRTIVNQQVHAFAVILYFGAILVIAVLALSVRTRRAMTLVDLSMLTVAALQCLNRFYTVTAAKPPVPGVPSSHVYYGTDEGSLIHMAAKTLLHGGRIYGTQWPQIFTLFHVGTTPLMNGGAATGLDYPPLGPVFTAFPMGLHLSHPPAGLAATAMLLLASAVMFLLLPVAWRPVAVIVCFGFGWLPNYAQMGYPGCMELPFLLVTVAYWHRTGRGGRLGWIGVTQAVCLGIACCLHQLSWFLAPFLLVGMFMIRRGELSARQAVAVVLRYAAISTGVFVVINLPFVLQGPHAWLEGVLTPLTQQAIPAGQGLVGISSFFTSGSGDLHLYSVAGQLLGLAMMVLLVLFPRRLGPAVTVMPWLVFYLSTRSQQDYFDLTVPLWVMAAATVSAADFDRAWHPRLGPLARRSVRTAVVPLLLTPTVLAIAGAVLTPPPLKMNVTTMTGTAGNGQLALVDLLTRVRVTVSNTSDAPVSPHFATSTGATISDYWKVLSGPGTLLPHSTAVYLLKAPWGGVDAPGVKGRILLRAVSSQPMTLSSQLIGVGPDPSTLPATIRRILDSGRGFPRSGAAEPAPRTGAETVPGR